MNFSVKNKFRFEKKDKYEYLKWAMWLMFFIQILALAIFNLTQTKYHLGYDASSYYLKAMEMAKQKTVFIDNWVNQTTLYFDSPVPLAALFYGITKNIYFSYGLANFIIDLCIFSVFFSLTKSLKLSELSSVICLNMIACIFISPSFNNANDVSYFSSTLASGNWYGVKILIVLMVIKMVFDINNKHYNYLFIVATNLLLFVSGVSSGWYLIVTVLLPIVVFYCIKVLVKNDYKELRSLGLIATILGIVFVFVGKVLAVYALHFESKDSEMILVGLNDFWKNIGSIVLGFMDLMCAFHHNSEISALSLDGIVYLLGFATFLIICIGFVTSIKKVIKSFCDYEQYALMLCIVVFNVLMFSVLYTTYGAEIFENRYLIPFYMLMVLMTGLFLDSINKDLIIKWIFCFGIFVIFAGLNIFYDTKFYSSKNNIEVLNSVIEEINRYNTQVVYVYGDGITFHIDERNLRVVDPDHVYKMIPLDNYNYIPHWGDYTYYDDVAEGVSGNVLISNPEGFELLPDYIKNQYELKTQIDKFYIYYADVSKFDFVSGITDNYGFDWATTPGYSYANAEIDEQGAVVTNGTEGFVFWGPNANLSVGNYDFIINYEVEKYDEKVADLYLTFNAGEQTITSIPLDPNQTSAEVTNVSFLNDCSAFEFKVYNYPGCIIRIISVEIKRK